MTTLVGWLNTIKERLDRKGSWKTHSEYSNILFKVNLMVMIVEATLTYSTFSIGFSYLSIFSKVILSAMLDSFVYLKSGPSSEKS